jgi:hypothetical protein
MGFKRVRAEHGSGRIAVLALRPIIEKKLLAGWTLRKIFREHEHELRVNYNPFRYWVRREIQDITASTKKSAAPDVTRGRDSNQPL